MSLSEEILDALRGHGELDLDDIANRVAQLEAEHESAKIDIARLVRGDIMLNAANEKIAKLETVIEAAKGIKHIPVDSGDAEEAMRDLSQALAALEDEHANIEDQALSNRYGEDSIRSRLFGHVDRSLLPDSL
jgi:hypothetical protein